jgi:hypothetical protein
MEGVDGMNLSKTAAGAGECGCSVLIYAFFSPYMLNSTQHNGF